MNTKFPKLQSAPLKDMSSFESQPNAQAVMSTDCGKVVVVALKRGQSLASHQAPGDALVYCLEGSVVFNFDKDQATLQAGDFFTMEKGTTHSVEAPQDTKVMLTIFKA